MPCSDAYGEREEFKQKRVAAGLPAETPDLPWEVLNSKGKVIAAFACNKTARDYASEYGFKIIKCPC